LLGANVVNLSLVIGGATIVGKVLPIVGDYWRYELAAVFLTGLAPILLLMDGGLSRLDGLILLVIYLLYLEGVVIDGRKQKSLVEESIHRRGIITRIKLFRRNGKGGFFVNLLLGIGLMIVASDGIVRLVVELAPVMRLSTTVLGILLVSLGTTLPELSLSLAAAAKKEVALILGNLFGTIATNATLIVGLLALIRPFKIKEMASYSLVNVGFVVIFGCFWLFTSTKKRLDRWEGVILAGLFLTFAGLELLFTPNLR
jgi:cation:H+ antiporter